MSRSLGLQWQSLTDCFSKDIVGDMGVQTMASNLINGVFDKLLTTLNSRNWVDLRLHSCFQGQERQLILITCGLLFKLWSGWRVTQDMFRFYPILSRSVFILQPNISSNIRFNIGSNSRILDRILDKKILRKISNRIEYLIEY